MPKYEKKENKVMGKIYSAKIIQNFTTVETFNQYLLNIDAELSVAPPLQSSALEFFLKDKQREFL